MVKRVFYVLEKVNVADQIDPYNAPGDDHVVDFSFASHLL